MTTQTKPFEAGPLRQVSQEQTEAGWILTFTEVFTHSCPQVWAALTRIDELAEWAPYVPDRDLDSPGPAQLIMNGDPDRTAYDGEVLTVEQPWRLHHRFGDDLLRWTLFEQAGGTRLVLHHTITDGDMRFMVAAGWHICVVVLDRLLAGAAIGPIVGEHALAYGFEELRSGYEARLTDGM